MEDAYFYSEEPEDEVSEVNEEQPIEEHDDDQPTESTEAPQPTEVTSAPTDEPEGADSPRLSSRASSQAPSQAPSQTPSQAPSANSIPLGSPVSSYHCSQNSNQAIHAGRGSMVDSITDAARYPLRLDRFFHEHDLMVPKDKDLDSIEANEKSWTMVRPSGPSVTDGISWSFVDICSGLSSELLKVCHFFDVMNGMSNHHPWNGFVVPTEDISGGGQGRNLRLKYNRKEVIGVVDSKHVETGYNLSLGSSGRRGVDTAKLLQASELTSAGTQNTSLPLFKIQLSFTAAFFKADQANSEEDEEDGELKQGTFGVATITSLRNVDALKLIVVPSLFIIFISLRLPEVVFSYFVFSRTASWQHHRRAHPTSRACTRGSESCSSSLSTS